MSGSEHSSSLARWLNESTWSRHGRGPGAGSDGPGRLPLLIAHRGASALLPENSLAAFDRARTDGADGVELDVLQCATGEVVVFHDDDLTRLGGEPTRISDLSLADLRAVRLRSGATIPTLEEAIEACGDHLLVNVELKAADLDGLGIRSLVHAVAASVERVTPGLAARILVSSFNPRAVHRWQVRAPQIGAGLLVEQASPLPLRRAWALPLLRPFSVHAQGVLATPEAISRWHRRGYRVAVWTIDEATALRRFTEGGVDVIITNHPARSRRLLRGGSA